MREDKTYRLVNFPGRTAERSYFRWTTGLHSAGSPGWRIPDVLAEVGPRLKRVRTQHDVTLTELAAATGTSKSTLSRLESGKRKPSLELLLPIALAHRILLDELVGAPEIGDPRIRLNPEKGAGERIVVPLTRPPRGVHGWKAGIPPERGKPQLRTHEGYERLNVLAGELTLLIADHDVTVKARGVAAIDTQFPDWFGSAGGRPVAIPSTHGREVERIPVGAAPRRKPAESQATGP